MRFDLSDKSNVYLDATRHARAGDAALKFETFKFTLFLIMGALDTLSGQFNLLISLYFYRFWFNVSHFVIREEQPRK